MVHDAACHRGRHLVVAEDGTPPRELEVGGEDDELGYLQIDKRGVDLIFQLVSRRYERRSTIVTTNVGMGSWAKVFGDPVVASAIADRLCHHCHLIRITGRSYRTKDLAPQDRASSAVVADSGAPR